MGSDEFKSLVLSRISEAIDDLAEDETFLKQVLNALNDEGLGDSNVDNRRSIVGIIHEAAETVNYG